MRFEYDHTDYSALLADLATALNTEVSGNQLNLPPHFGSGFVKVLVLPNGLNIALYNCVIHHSFYFARQKSSKEYYTLRFDTAELEQMTVKLDDSYEELQPHLRAAVLLTSSLFDFAYLLRGNTRVQGLNIFFSSEWMMRYLGIQDTDDVLRKYLSLKTAAFNFEPMDAEYRKWLQEIFDSSPDHPLYTALVENRAMLLAERFFNRLYSRMAELTDIRISNRDIHRIMKVENILIRDFASIPPTIQQIADQVEMSVSKLKKDFKLVYGLPVYEYYQKHRMRRAKELLLTGDYSVKEVGYKLGYQNLSNFSHAFRKEFNVLPSELSR